MATLKDYYGLSLEEINPTTNISKYHLFLNLKLEDTVTHFWGRIGKIGGREELSIEDADTKLAKKIKQGYEVTSTYNKYDSLGDKALSFQNKVRELTGKGNPLKETKFIDRDTNEVTDYYPINAKNHHIKIFDDDDFELEDYLEELESRKLTESSVALDIKDIEATDSSLEQLTDVTKNPSEAISPEFLIDVNSGANDTEYNEANDPEEIKEAKRDKETKLKLLQESQEGVELVAAFINKGGTNFNDYLKSEYFTDDAGTALRFYKRLKSAIDQGYIKNVKKATEILKQTETLAYKPKPVTSGVRGRPKQGATIDENGNVIPSRNEIIEIYDKPKSAPSKVSDKLQQFASKYATADDVSDDVNQIFNSIKGVVRDICLQRAQQRHALISGDAGVGKTYTVTESLKKYIGQSPTNAKYKMESGDIGTSGTSIYSFFYRYRENYVIVLDDNDKMIVRGSKMANTLKSLLDPNMPNTGMPVTLLDKVATGVEAYDDDDEEIEPSVLDTKRENKGVDFEIDGEKLREGIFHCYINNDEIYEYIPLNEAMKLYNQLEPLNETKYVNPYTRHLYEGDMFDFDKEEKSDTKKSNKISNIEDDDEPTEEEKLNAREIFERNLENEPKAESIPRKFRFKSNVIFISNLRTADIDTAVKDRATVLEVSLTLDQYFDRLCNPNVFAGLCKTNEFISIDKTILDWAKKCTLGCLKIVIEAWNANYPLFGQVPIIRSKLTFRDFSQFTGTWLRLAWDEEENTPRGSLGNQQFRDKVAIKIEPLFIKNTILTKLKSKSADYKTYIKTKLEGI